MPAHRRANYVQLTADKFSLDLLSAKYSDLRFILPPVKKITITDAFEANLPGLAYSLWGEPDYGYWWVIALYNGIIDPIEEIITGKVILIPDLEQVKKLLQTTPDFGQLPTTTTVNI